MGTRAESTAVTPRVLAVVGAANAGSGPAAEVLGAARSLCVALGARLTALLIADGATPADAPTDADEVFVARAPWLSPDRPDACLAALAAATAAFRPAVVVLSHDATGRDIAPRLAARLGAGVVTDCVALAVEPGSGTLLATRPSFSGKALGEWALHGPDPTVITIRRGAFAPSASSTKRPEPAPFTITGSPDPRVRLLERVAPPPGETRLEDADVVVAVGRGVGTREAFEEHIRDGLARVLGASCGGSRGAADLGIVAPELQIGLTGRMVSPKLYIAVGLSGSPQHMAGCSGARTIVAVNTDPQAPIFGFAHYGVVGDYRRVLPSLTGRLATLGAGR